MFAVTYAIPFITDRDYGWGCVLQPVLSLQRADALPALLLVACSHMTAEI